MKKDYQHRYGWYWLAKEVADYCNTTFFEIMNRSALEVVGLTLIIQNQIEYKNMK